MNDPIIEYIYYTAEGNELHKTTVQGTGEDKDVIQFHFANNQWVTGLGNIKPVLYKLPYLILNKNSSEPFSVYIVEGEKDADTLEKKGEIATTNPMGAGKWKDSYSPFLKGCDVVILPDNDEAGCNHAEQVAESIYLYAKSVKVVHLPLFWKECPQKGDITDFFESGGTLEQLEAAVQSCPLWKGKVIRVLDMLKSPSEQEEKLLDPFLNRSGLTVLYGSSDIGKSLLLRQLSLDIVMGREEFCGFKLHPKHKSVLYISTEDDEHITEQTIRKQAKIYGDGLEALSNFHVVFEMDGFKIEDFLQIRPVDLIVVDCLIDAMTTGKANDANDVRRFYEGFKKIIRENDVAVIMLHHSGKRAEYGEPSKHNAVGSQAVVSTARAAFEFRKESDDDDSLRHFCVAKGNYLPSEFKRSSYVLRFNDDSLRFSEETNADGTHHRREFSTMGENTFGEQRSVRTACNVLDVFQDDVEELQRKEIVRRCTDSYGVSVATVDNRLNAEVRKGTLIPLSYGKYRRA